MKNNKAIYLIPLTPIFNEEKLTSFPHFTKKDTAYLYKTLFKNNKEIIENFKNVLDVYLFIDENDKNLVTDDYKIEGAEVIYYSINSFNEFYKWLSDKFFSKYLSNLVIFSQSIGFTNEDIVKTLDLLNIEDDALVIGRTHNNMLAFLGFNKINVDVLLKINFDDFVYDNFLSVVCKENIFINTLDNFLFLKTFEDFKLLYHELSKKESYSYCKNETNEHFTNLFIEYKDLLK